jgi:hypothetical protein
VAAGKTLEVHFNAYLYGHGSNIDAMLLAQCFWQSYKLKEKELACILHVEEMLLEFKRYHPNYHAACDPANPVIHYSKK